MQQQEISYRDGHSKSWDTRNGIALISQRRNRRIQPMIHILPAFLKKYDFRALYVMQWNLQKAIIKIILTWGVLIADNSTWNKMMNVPRATITSAQKAIFQDLLSNLATIKHSNRGRIYWDLGTTLHEYTTQKIYFNTPTILVNI